MAMAGGGSLLDLCLAEAQLGQYSASFQARGVRDLEALASISMQEYTSYGVTPAEDKKQLFRLIHTLRNLDLNKLSDMKSDNTPRLDDVENCEVPDSSQGDISHLENKKAVKNHHNKAFQSSRNLPVVNSPSERGEEKREHPRMLKDTPRNSVLNRTFDMDDDSDKEKSEQSDVEVNVYNQDEGDGGNHGDDANRGDDADAEVHIVEHERTGYNYGVPSASPATQSRLKSAAKSTPSNASRAGGTGFEERIRVCVRKRPMSRKEWKGGEGEAVTTEGQTTVLVKERKLAVDLTKVIQVHKYHFDEVFHEACSNEEVYERTAKPLVSAIFNKCNATCFAYGQTGAGKTHTLLGGHGKVKGLYLLAAEDIFRAIRSSLEGAVLVVYISYFEIYCGQLFDLLNNRERLLYCDVGGTDAAYYTNLPPGSSGQTKIPGVDIQSVASDRLLRDVSIFNDTVYWLRQDGVVVTRDYASDDAISVLHPITQDELGGNMALDLWQMTIISDHSL
ncbi:kinesin-like protein KIF24 [Diadema antillarum]|uniref:kinesin-like protein KIF24 n=2 Tax=Diadema antillarum TaxID=105358 RepID=UPI003A893139